VGHLPASCSPEPRASSRFAGLGKGSCVALGELEEKLVRHPCELEPVRSCTEQRAWHSLGKFSSGIFASSF